MHMLDLEFRDFTLLDTDSYGARFSSCILPAMLAARSSDWCETFFISKSCIALSIGDVCGHGIEQYALMVAVRTIIHDAVVRGLSPNACLGEANRYLCTHHPDKTATAILAFLDTEKHSFRFANAGHPPPLMVSASKASFLEYADTDLMLGVDIAAKPTMRVVDLEAATLVVLYTDGVIEHGKDAIKGVDELIDAAIRAYDCSSSPQAHIIEKNMYLTGLNSDDASILTAFVD